MDNRVGSPSWLPEGAAHPSAEEPATEGPAPAGLPGGGSEGTFAYGGGEGTFAYGQGGSYLYQDEGGAEGTPGYSSDSAYAAGAASGSGFGSEGSRPPQVPAPLPAPDSAGHWPRQTDAPGGGMAGARTSVYSTDTRSPKQAAQQPRRANLVLARIDPWSVMKFSFLMSLVAWLILFVAVAVLYYFLSTLGVFTSIQHTLQSVTSSQSSSGVQLSKYVSESKVLGYTMLIGGINVVIITALSTVGAVIYNLVTRLGAGIEITLKEGD